MIRPYRPIALLIACLLLSGCGLLGGPAKPEPEATPVSPDSGEAQPPPPQPTAKETPQAAVVKTISTYRPQLLTAVRLTSGVTSLPSPLSLSAGRSEWLSVVLRVHTPEPGTQAWLKLPVWVSGNTALRGKSAKVYQVLPMPLDVNRAGYVRQTGLPVAAESLPRALLPVAAANGQIDLTKLRDPSRPADASAKAADTDVLLWVDIRVGIDATPGHYDADFQWLTIPPNVAPNGPAAVAAKMNVGLDVADFVLPDDRHLSMVADISWDRLRGLWPDRFEAVQPQLLNRTDKRVKSAVDTLDALVTLAQENRVQVHVPKLQPVVKWPAGKPVNVIWDDYDDLVGPWLGGQAFADRVPMGFWALPRIDFLDNVPAPSQLEYYQAAAAHFDQRDWLRVSPVVLTKQTPGRASVTERFQLSAEASRVLRSHSRVRVMLPLEADEAQLSNEQNPDLIDPTATARLNCVAPGLISNSALFDWPKELDRPQNWLRTDLSGLIPYTGAGGDEADVRVWAWVAFLRRANLIQWDACLPAESKPDTPADPNELVWFYPGSWFGVDTPVPTVQLKWLRRAQQDFEYLRLAEQRGSLLNVLPMARLLAKPVEIQPNQSADPVYGLLIGTADQTAWDALRPILTQTIQTRGPGVTPSDDTVTDLNQQTLSWMEPLERPVILARTTDWNVGDPPAGSTGTWVNLKLGMDLYNASDTTPQENELSFVRFAAGWVAPPRPVVIPKLSMFQVTRQNLNARIDPARANAAYHVPVRIDFKSGQTGATTPLELVAPVSRSVRRTEPLVINGDLSDWAGDDAIQMKRPLVKMMSRPAVQAHALEYASTETSLFSAWGDDDWYAAFRVEGLAASTGRAVAARNFVDYQVGRAWGEDLCEAIIQAVYDDGTVGPQVHVAVKPGGNVWVERRQKDVQPWKPFESGVRYATTAEKAVWRGEIAVPWDAIIEPAKTAEFAGEGKPNRPTLLKFNFIQHKRQTGETASWAGPIDAGRETGFTGVILLKEPAGP